MDDEKIIQLYFQRREDAIQETDTAYGRKLFCLSNRILRCQEDAQECVNDTYWKTWNTIPPQKPQYFYAFLSAICRRISFNKIDWQSAAKRNGEVVALTEEMAMCIPDLKGQCELEGKELGKLLDRFLQDLPKESRLIFLRRYWYVDTIAQIAARYGMTESKVKMQLSRTRAKLQTYLESEGIYV